MWKTLKIALKYSKIAVRNLKKFYFKTDQNLLYWLKRMKQCGMLFH